MTVEKDFVPWIYGLDPRTRCWENCVDPAERWNGALHNNKKDELLPQTYCLLMAGFPPSTSEISANSNLYRKAEALSNLHPACKSNFLEQRTSISPPPCYPETGTPTVLSSSSLLSSEVQSSSL